ncbi:unnamed protein product [Pseudo-nitzschia multistriata]|uniref:Carrier domain-containing protein n=1 Tax=Pseudo-nitzschia multistriata TaxID=183589 RepID=A0A448Z072_9STRA|nr:unnamed protein product [Pseudo-nitzschia multistriata]
MPTSPDQSSALILLSKPRLLCLHGSGSNSVVTQAQLRNLGFHKCFGVTHLVAPLLCSGEIDENVRSVCEDGSFYSWMNKTKDNKGCLPDLVASLKFVLRHVIQEGPYDAVYGFSQGAGIAAILSCRAIRKKLLWDMGETKVDENPATDNPWKFIFAACATLPIPWRDITHYLKLSTITSIEVPSVHLIGIDDPLKQSSERFFDDFNGDDDKKLPVYFEGGHEIVSTSGSLGRASYAAIEWFSNFNPKWILPSIGFDDSPLCAIAKEINGFTVGSSSQETLNGTFGQYQLNAICDRDFDLSMMRLLENEEIEHKIAFRAPGKAPMTYGALRRFVRGRGNLSTIGCTRGDKVAYLTPYGVLGAVAFVSISAQCTAVPLDPESSSADLVMAFRQLRPDVLIVFDDLGADVCEQASSTAANAGVRVIDASGDFKEATFSFADCEQNNKDILENKGSDTCILLRTSGTTSEPKIVPLDTWSILTNAIAIANNLGLRDTDVALNAMPLFHIGGLMTNLLASFVSGGSSIFLPKFNVSTFAERLTKSKGGVVEPTWFSTVPSILAALESYVSSSEESSLLRSSLRFVRVGAAAISDDLIIKCQQTFGCRVVPTYSMTECMPISQPQQDATIVDERPGSVGRALAVSICIVNSNLVPLPYRKKGRSESIIGEVCISGSTVTKGYLSNDEANRSAFFRLAKKSWFRTGDLGYLDRDGYLYLTGRSKDMIKVNGEQVSPIEVEEACMRFPGVELCIAFSQPSNNSWGEQVGIACVLSASNFDRGHSSLVDEMEFQTELRRFLKVEQGLVDWKIPERIQIVCEGDLPKTKSGKYKRAGLDKILDEAYPSSATNQPMADRDYLAKKMSPLHPAAVGVQFVLAVAVMYVHIGNLNVWAIDSPTEGSGTYYYQRLVDRTGVGAFSEWSNTRTWCFHTPLFFFVGGFLLATGTHSPILGKSALLGFYKVRILSLHPMYLLSVLLCVAIFVVQCHPENFIPGFDRTRTPIEGEAFVCQAAPVEMSWGGTLISSIVTYSLLLQSWPVAIPFTWFLSYYTWFSSVYMFCIFVFPWCHKPFFAAKDDRTALWKLTISWLGALYVFVGIFSAGLAVSDNESTLNWFALSMYLFPPGWLPCFSLGIGASFLLEHYRRKGEVARYAKVSGLLTDFISLFLLAGWIFYGTSSSSLAAPSSVVTDIGERYWAAYVSRLVCPLGFVWFIGLAIGRGVTARILSRHTVVCWLAPSSYNVFLFHQPISELYFFATRRIWWAYPKSFYWFSPYPIPVKTWEIPIVMTIVILFSMLMHFYVNGVLIGATTNCIRCGFKGERQQDGEASHDHGQHHPEIKSVATIVLETIARVCHIDPSRLRGETDLTEIGMSSMTLPVAISEINSALKSHPSEAKLALRHVQSMGSITDLVSLASEGGSSRAMRSSLRASRLSRSASRVSLGSSRHSTNFSLFGNNNDAESSEVEDVEEGLRF